MKKKIKLFVSVFLVLASVCLISAKRVSALSAENESIISQIASELGADIGGMIDSFIGTSQATTIRDGVLTDDTGRELASLAARLDIASKVSTVMDLTAYLQKGGSFRQWVADNYGGDVEVSDSINNLSDVELVKFLMNSALNPTTAGAEENASTTASAVSEPHGETDSLWADESDSSAEEISLAEQESDAVIDPEYKTGDADGDGSVTAADARIALRISAKLITPDRRTFLAADVNGDNHVTAKDARSILRFSARLTSSF